MEELIKFTRRNGKKVVSGRELHAYLENKDKFATWIKDRIKQYGFVENQDYTTYSGSSEKGRPSEEYAVTLGMAKELGMVERNEKGSKIRKYFIEMEKIAQPDFTQISGFEDHMKRPVQVLNSKEVNTHQYEQGGTKQTIEYNQKNCQLHTGLSPKQIKKKFEKSNLPAVVKNSAKEILRRVDPVTACAMSLTDNMVKMGKDHEKAAEVSNKHGREVFKFMLDNGITPGELGLKF